MSNNLDLSVSGSIDMKDMGFQRPRCCDDPYYARGRDFPMPDSDKGTEAGPESLTGGATDKQRSPRLNANKPGEANSTWGEEGKAFPGVDNGKESSDESPTFAGEKDSTVSVNLVSGQIESTNVDRLVPVPLSGPDNGDKIRARMNFKKTTADSRENRI